MPDGILAVGDGFDHKYRLIADDVIRLGQVDEWPFGVALVTIDRAFENKLSLGGHKQVNRFGMHQVERLIQVKGGQCIGDFQLIDAKLDGSGSRARTWGGTPIQTATSRLPNSSRNRSK